MKIDKKYIIAGSIAVVSLTIAALYLQYKKLTDSCISFNKFVLRKLTLNDANLDIFLNFVNLSKIKINIVSQDYIAYLNDKEIARASNAIPQVILPNGSSVLALNVAFNPSKLGNVIGGLAKDFIMNPSNIVLKVKVNVKVKLYMFNISIPYEYITTFKDLTANNQQNKSTTNKKKC